MKNQPESQFTKEVERQVKDAICKLGEHCDSVQVFVTIVDPEDKTTHSFQLGTGNWYARLGQVKEWVKRIDLRDEAEMMREADPEDGL